MYFTLFPDFISSLLHLFFFALFLVSFVILIIFIFYLQYELLGLSFEKVYFSVVIWLEY